MDVAVAEQRAAVAETDPERIRALFEAQHENRWVVAKTTARERRAKLKRLRRAIQAHEQDLADAMWADLHKASTEVDLTEIQPAYAEITHAVRHIGRWMRPVHVDTPVTHFGTRSEVRYEPKGVALVIAPWNYPFNLLVNPLVAAIAAGNCVVLKPSEKTPATSAVIARLVRDSFDENEVAVVEGGVETAKALLDLPFDHIFFTGSTAVGRIVMEAAARNLASVTLELGGKSPVLVDRTADIAEAARRVAWGKLLNAGQTCVAPDYALVEASRAKEFVSGVVAAVERFYGATEEARRASPDLCRMIDRGAFERVAGLVDDAVASGATVVIGGERNESERYIAPTVLTGVALDAKIMREEIFGPVLPVLTYQTLDEAISIVHSLGKPLALYIFSRSDRVVEEVMERTTAGGTAVNNVVVHLANPHLPFGGVGTSGLGSYHGEFGFRAFSHERAVLRQGWPHGFRHFYPPYTPRVRRLVRLVTRWLS